VLKVIVPVKEEIVKAAERRKAKGLGDDISLFLAELIDLGFEHRLQQLYKRFESGEISIGFFAMEIGLNIRDLYATLEKRGLPTSNINKPIPNLG
jgi:hypothetical protein